MAINTDYRTMRDIAIDRIRQMILDERLKPGARVSQEDLSAQLGVSRMPVREALNALEAEGLIVSVPHRGSVIAPISEEDIEEVTIIRCALEGIAANRGAVLTTESDLQTLKRLLDEMAENCEEMGDAYQHYRLHRAFHFQIYETSGMNRLCRLIAPLWDASERYRRAGASLPGRRKEAWQEHADLYEACIQKDGERAERLVIGHLKRTASMYIEALRHRSGQD